MTSLPKEDLCRITLATAPSQATDTEQTAETRSAGRQSSVVSGVDLPLVGYGTEASLTFEQTTRPRDFQTEINLALPPPDDVETPSSSISRDSAADAEGLVAGALFEDVTARHVLEASSPQPQGNPIITYRTVLNY